MASITVEELTVASQILLSRLTRPNTIDIGIAMPNELGPGVRIERFLTRYIGCLDYDEDSGLLFYLAARSHPERDIDHIIVFYFNRYAPEIMESEMGHLADHLPRIKQNDHGIKLGVVNVFCDAPIQLHLSSFIIAIDHLLGRPLITKFKPRVSIKVSLGEISVGPAIDCDLSHCDGKIRTLDRFRALVRDFGQELQLGDAQRHLWNPAVVMIRDRGHLIGCFYNEQCHSVTYLVTHRNQFQDAETYARVKKMTARKFSRGSLKFYVTRFHANTHRRCDDELVQMAWRLILWMQPNVLLSISENELHYMQGNLDKINPHLQALRHSRERLLIQSQSPELIDEASQDVDANLIMSSQQVYPMEHLTSVLFQTYDYDELWTNNLSTIEELSCERRRIRDSIVPPVHEMQPYLVLTQGYLRCLPSYEEAIKLTGQIWSRYADTFVYPKLLTILDAVGHTHGGAHFVICPLDYEIGQDHIIVVDTRRCEWIHLDPSNRSYADRAHMVDVVTHQFNFLFPEFSSYSGRAVSMSSITHKDYPRLHLLMALYVISRLFHYTKELPQVIIYGEWELRKYGHNICNELQAVNAVDNVTRGRIDDNGHPTVVERCTKGSVHDLS